LVRGIVWSRRALHDLRGIFGYIARDSKFYAQIQVERIQAAALKLSRFPESGRVVPEFPSEQWREVLTGNYRLIYRISEDKIKILAVVHGQRLLRETMISRE